MDFLWAAKACGVMDLSTLNGTLPKWTDIYNEVVGIYNAIFFVSCGFDRALAGLSINGREGYFIRVKWGQSNSLIELQQFLKNRFQHTFT